MAGATLTDLGLYDRADCAEDHALELQQAINRLETPGHSVYLKFKDLAVVGRVNMLLPRKGRVRAMYFVMVGDYQTERETDRAALDHCFVRLALVHDVYYEPDPSRWYYRTCGDGQE